MPHFAISRIPYETPKNSKILSTFSKVCAIYEDRQILQTEEGFH